jgi:hypothetical protein
MRSGKYPLPIRTRIYPRRKSSGKAKPLQPLPRLRLCGDSDGWQKEGAPLPAAFAGSGDFAELNQLLEVNLRR